MPKIFLYLAYKTDPEVNTDMLLECEADILIETLERKKLPVHPRLLRHEPGSGAKPLSIIAGENPGECTLYVFAHGNARSVGDEAGKVSLDAAALARQLHEDGLPAGIGQIKLYACNSAVPHEGFNFARDLCVALHGGYCTYVVVHGYLGKAGPDIKGIHRLLVDGKRGRDAKRSYVGPGAADLVSLKQSFFIFGLQQKLIQLPNLDFLKQ
jgi:hypothetical protein